MRRGEEEALMAVRTGCEREDMPAVNVRACTVSASPTSQASAPISGILDIEEEDDEDIFILLEQEHMYSCPTRESVFWSFITSTHIQMCIYIYTVGSSYVLCDS